MKHTDLVRTAMTVDDQLDDITRARIWSRLEDRLDEAPAPRARWPIMLGVAAVAAAGVLVMVRVGGQATEGDARTLMIPADTTVTSKLGPYTRAALVGAAELEIVGTPGMATSVRLRHGMLLADFDGGPGRSLRVEAPGAIVDIVGTLFAVEARGGDSCTSVVEGRVRVTTSSRAVFVGAGERYCTTGPAEPQPIDDSVRGALERHGTVIAAQTEPLPSPVATLPAAPTVTAPPAPPEASVPTHPSPVSRASAVPKRTQIAAVPAAVPVPDASVPTPTSPPARPSSPEPLQHGPSAPERTHIADEPAAAAPPAASVPPPRSAPAGVAAPQPVSPRMIPSPPTPKPPVTADDLYRAAETALIAGAPGRADQSLARLVTEFPSSSLVDQALYERARIAYQQRAWATARRHLDRLAALPRTTLAEPGHYLTCRIAVETRDGGAVSCLVDYRKAFPGSPHDLQALALVVQLTHASRGCAGVANEIDELVRSHPKSKHAAAWRARCPERP